MISRRTYGISLSTERSCRSASVELNMSAYASRSCPRVIGVIHFAFSSRFTVEKSLRGVPFGLPLTHFLKPFHLLVSLPFMRCFHFGFGIVRIRLFYDCFCKCFIHLVKWSFLSLIAYFCNKHSSSIPCILRISGQSLERILDRAPSWNTCALSSHMLSGCFMILRRDQARSLLPEWSSRGLFGLSLLASGSGACSLRYHPSLPSILCSPGRSPWAIGA